mmetsp:Transcript_11753/g.28963  ORF Transcript_11753/g.28963 Transcript_11753/m.28963 type:complete len:620 (-) Transcript_11753:202-2061(-)|eukprot:CAMPEP_0114491430 /NCGR_PEP_ID=MMETSP0109-20121206/2995_1 /TAXON_ID=29199 /ORGANISM="Chlorarachnion reptans, Strain CCCM449" /LENGTH=619 /DNA_ID=CAMNT_0001668161 /DNA_START=88 /DNA_END=1947 /DNA_ORIENTATION=-
MPRRVGRFLVMSLVKKKPPSLPEDCAEIKTPEHFEPVANNGENQNVKRKEALKKSPPSPKELQAVASMMDGNHPELIPDLVPNRAIKIIEKIGEGAFSDVYRGMLYGQPVVVKTLKEYNSSELMAEVRVMQTLRHPNIVEYLGVTVHRQNNLAIVAEFLEGGTLTNFLARERKAGRKLRLRRVIIILKDIIRGLSWLHHRCIIHRDLKPSNIMMDKYGKCKICDFGLAHRKESKRIGGHYGVCGTLSYSAPEVLDDEEYGYPSDIFSWSIVAAEVIEGDYPIKLDAMGIKMNGKEGMLRRDFAAAIVKGYRPKMPTGVPKDLAELLRGCWQKDPAARPEAEAVFDTLSDIETEHHLKNSSASADRVRDVIEDLPEEAAHIFENQLAKNAKLREELKDANEKLIRCQAEAAELRAQIERMKITSIPMTAAAATAVATAATKNSSLCQKASPTAQSPKQMVVEAAAAAAMEDTCESSSDEDEIPAPIPQIPQEDKPKGASLSDLEPAAFTFDQNKPKTPLQKGLAKGAVAVGLTEEQAAIAVAAAPSLIPVVIVGRPKSEIDTKYGESIIMKDGGTSETISMKDGGTSETVSMKSISSGNNAHRALDSLVPEGNRTQATTE